MRGELFQTLDFFDIYYPGYQKLIHILAVCDLEWICVQDDYFCDTDSKTKLSKHFPIFVSTWYHLTPGPTFLCISNQRELVESCVDVFDGWATQRKIQLKMNFLDSGISVNN